jgi:acetyl-CoA carboxylase biotin carboxyl carrier protein
VFTFEQVKELMELVANRGLAELDIERQGFRLKITGVRESLPAPMAPVAAMHAAAPVVSMVSAPMAAPSGAAVAAAAPPPAVAAEAASDLHYVTSPIVGTFYVAPAPDAAPFVAPGDRVRKGQILCIIEAMKLMNEIESDVDGVLVEVLVKNAQPVEYGERLFAVRAG